MKTLFDQALVGLYGPLKGMALAKTNNYSDAEDLVQQTLLKCLERENTFQPGTNLVAWAVTVLKNLNIDNYRKKTEVLVEGETLEFLGGSVEEGVSNKIDILKCLEVLSVKQREVLLLNVNEGWTAKEIAEMLGSKINTVLSQMARARKRFGLCIDAEPEPAK